MKQTLREIFSLSRGTLIDAVFTGVFVCSVVGLVKADAVISHAYASDKLRYEILVTGIKHIPHARI